jgi:small-conductance mechanosensitive channel
MGDKIGTALSLLNNVNLVFVLSAIFVIVFRQQLENIASAVVLYISPKVNVGDNIKVSGIKGKVLSIGFNVTINNIEDDYIAYIPASVFITRTVQNYTLGNGDKTEIYKNE